MKVVIENFLTKQECDELIALGENLGFQNPKIKTPKGEVVDKSFRSNGSALVDSVELANKLFDSLKDKLPENIRDYTLCGLNEQLKIYKYSVGQQFKMHKDVPYVRNDNERSFLTMLIYLNEDYRGGETFFLDGNVNPCVGKCLVFKQNMLHAGLLVTEGVKYAIRTDVMYKKLN